MKLSHLVALGPLSFLFACDGTPPERAPAVQESALECSDAAELIAPDLAVMDGCPFENHVHKILAHGHALAPAILVDRDGREVAEVQGACERYWLGTDADGVQVIVDGTTGQVTSHGMVHQGEPLSALDGAVALPLSLEAP